MASIELSGSTRYGMLQYTPSGSKGVINALVVLRKPLTICYHLSKLSKSHAGLWSLSDLWPTSVNAGIFATVRKQCLGLELPAFVAIYRSAQDFIGQDIFTLEVIGADGKSQIQRITVTVIKPDVSQGI